MSTRKQLCKDGEQALSRVVQRGCETYIGEDENASVNRSGRAGSRSRRVEETCTDEQEGDGERKREARRPEAGRRSGNAEGVSRGVHASRGTTYQILSTGNRQVMHALVLDRTSGHG